MNRNLCLAMLAGGLLASAAVAQNFGARLIDGSAILDYTTNGSSSLPTYSQGPVGEVPMNFQIDGFPGQPGTNQVYSGNWFYRIAGDDRERHFANASTRTPTGTNHMEWEFPTVYTGGASQTVVPDLSAHMHFGVYDTGQDTALFSTDACFINHGSTPITVDVFFAIDIDLDVSPGGDSYQALSYLGPDRLWTLNDGGVTGMFLGHSADGAGVGPVPVFMSQMTDTFPSDFIPDVNSGGYGAGDNAAVMQWHEIVYPGHRVCVDALVGIGRNGEIPVMPSPGAVVVMGVGAIAGLGRRRARWGR